ncbi:unnamed protein product [Rotaria sp. Silwood1]|nr:unnamed protein product [Rotaria sp. Silwood1]CAF1527941.1 unnamed protein product [Rotaria sp. Silwood1]
MSVIINNKLYLFISCLTYISILYVNAHPIRFDNSKTKQKSFYFDSNQKLNNHIYIQKYFQIKSSITNHPFIQTTTTTIKPFTINHSTRNYHRTTKTTTEYNHASYYSSSSSTINPYDYDQYDQNIENNQNDDSKVKFQLTHLNSIKQDERKIESIIINNSSQIDKINKDKQLNTLNYNPNWEKTIIKQVLILDV